MIDERLKEFATPRQLEYLEAVDKYGSRRKAALELGVDSTSIDRSLNGLMRRAALRGWSPDHDMRHIVPEPYLVKGTSTYYDASGAPTNQWVKTALDPDKYREMMAELWTAFAHDVPKLPPVPAPELVAPRLLNLYTFTDYHMGMLAWHQEGGADWDLDISVNVLRNCFRLMVDQSPPAKKCVINLQGDFLHTDGMLPLTPAHKHVLDADTRYRKIVKAAVQTIRELIAYALEKHEEVELLVVEGNHDECGSMWLQIVFDNAYGNEPRLTVHDQALPFYCIEHGKTFLGFHHGHKVKNEALPILFASQFDEAWGRTKKRYVHCGHRHHLDHKEYSGVTVTQHPTLAARDAHAARGGWIAERAAIGITYDVEWGKTGEVWCTPEMVM
jgi:hypothetical protein